MEGKDARRRLVQSTLFHQLGSSTMETENCDDNSEEAGLEGDDRCASSKKRGGSRRRVISKSRTPPSASSKKICLNGESVKILSEWLHQWHKKDSIASRVCMVKGDPVMHDGDHDYHQSDSDTENVEESLKNVLLVTGPVGSGKSAAIYASARDQGFQIIEVNASDCRNGSRVKQQFGEAVKSHW